MDVGETEVFPACYILLDEIYRIEFAFLTSFVSRYTNKLVVSSALVQKKARVHI